MNTIIGKQNLNATVRRLDIKDEALVLKLKPGHFVTITLQEGARPLPCHVFETDIRRKCLSIVFEMTDDLTTRLDNLKINDTVFAVSGPYGMPVPLEKKGTVILVGEGLGLVSLLNLARALKNVGNKVITLAGFESRKASLFESQLRLGSTRFQVMHKDGMHEKKGDVLGPLKKMLQDESPGRIYADVSFETLAGVRLLAAEKGVPVSINLMGLCAAGGSFSVNTPIHLSGRTFFPAVEGVVVDVQSVDMKELLRVAESKGEYFSCRKKEAGLLHQQNVFARLKKLFWE